jgi:hypothetical protein
LVSLLLISQWRCCLRLYTAERKPLIKVIFALSLFIYSALQLPSANTQLRRILIISKGVNSQDGVYKLHSSYVLIPYRDYSIHRVLEGLSLRRNWAPPWIQRGGGSNNRLRVRGWGDPIRTRKPGILCSLCFIQWPKI